MLVRWPEDSELWVGTELLEHNNMCCCPRIYTYSNLMIVHELYFKHHLNAVIQHGCQFQIHPCTSILNQSQSYEPLTGYYLYFWFCADFAAAKHLLQEGRFRLNRPDGSVDDVHGRHDTSSICTRGNWCSHSWGWWGQACHADIVVYSHLWRALVPGLTDLLT